MLVTNQTNVLVPIDLHSILLEGLKQLEGECTLGVAMVQWIRHMPLVWDPGLNLLLDTNVSLSKTL